MTPIALLCRYGLFSALVLSLAGCLSSTPTATLYSLQRINQPPLAPGGHGTQEMILVLPVRIAPHLQGRSLLYQQEDGEARAAASHLWSASLDKQLATQLTGQLQQLLATANVSLFPGPRYAQAGYLVELEVEEFSGDGSSFRTLATYTISDRKEKVLRLRKIYQHQSTIDTTGYTGYVHAASYALADLSKEVARSLAALAPSHSTQ
nr:PqiC family protein [uncultured Desulfobulbus sp.]